MVPDEWTRELSDGLVDREVREIFDILTKTSSILEKKKVLADWKDDTNFLKFLDYLLNPYFVTGLSEKKIRKEPTGVIVNMYNYDNFHSLMSYIRTYNTGTDEVIANVQYFLSSVMDKAMREFYIGIITKTIRLGCDAKTVNAALGFELIPIWEVQQAYQFGKVKLNDGEWFSLSQKLNGVRGTFYEGRIISRQGKDIPGLKHIISDISALLRKKPAFDCTEWVLDGELIRKNTDYISDNENFRMTAGILNQEDVDKSSIQFVVFDILPKEEFVKGSSELTYQHRYEQLKNLSVRCCLLDLESVRVVPFLYEGTDQSQIDIYLNQMVREGKEGLMLNRDTKYMRKRHNGILKIKRFYTVDLRIIDFEEGTGRLKGTLGAFIVKYKDNILHVGTGMTDEQRMIFWQNRENLVDRVIEVKYKEESRDKETGKPSLQFPVFVRLREEGKEESYE